MFGFKSFLENHLSLFSEYFKVKDYLEINQRAEKVFNWLFNQPEIRNFIKKIDEISIVKPLTPGKTGYLVLNRSQPSISGDFYGDDATGNTFQHRIPVKIDEVKGTDLTLSRTDDKDFEEISYLMPYFPDFGEKRSKNRILVPSGRVILVNNDKYLTFTRWIAYAVSEGSLQKNMKIPRYFRYFWRKSEENLLNSLKNDGLLSKLRTMDLKPENFFTNSDEIDAPITYSDAPKSLRGKKGGVGEEIISFPNGYKWLNLKRSYCSEESDAAGHCGNTGGKPDDEILSLRDKDNRVYLTFILNNGKLGEMKAVGNKKPDKSLHAYIIALLEKPFVKELVGGHWLPENDFKISDLGYEDSIRLKRKRPELFSSNYPGGTKLDDLLLKNRDRLIGYVRHLKSKHPILKDVGVFHYDDKNHYFVVSDDDNHGTHSIINYEYQKNWLGYVTRLIKEWREDSHKEAPFYEIKHLPKGELQDIINYLAEIKGAFREELVGIVKSFWEDYSKNINDLTNKELIQKIIYDSPEEWRITRLFNYAKRNDENLAHIIDKTLYASSIKTCEEKLNKKLRECPNDYGFFFQIKVDKAGYLQSEKCINASDVYEIMKTKDFKKSNNKDSLIDCLHHLHRDELGVRGDFFIEELKKNLKYLHYRVY
jgi:hypothetical protein